MPTPSLTFTPSRGTHRSLAAPWWPGPALHASKSPLALARARGWWHSRHSGPQAECLGLQQQRVQVTQISPQATASRHQEAVGEQGATYSQA